MFWRNKTATSHQSAEPPSAKSKGEIQENLVRYPANSDAARTGVVDPSAPARIAGLAAGERPYVIPSSYRVSGPIVSSRAVVVEGEILDGVIDAPTVYVSQSGRVACPTKAPRVMIHGSVEADVAASVEVFVGARATVKGSLNTPAIRIEPGAQVTEAALFVGPKR